METRGGDQSREKAEKGNSSLEGLFDRERSGLQTGARRSVRGGQVRLGGNEMAGKRQGGSKKSVVGKKREAGLTGTNQEEDTGISEKKRGGLGKK